MAGTVWVQDVFSKGELSPSMYARVSAKQYYKGLKVAKNVLPNPQGGARKRFALKRKASLAQTDYKFIYPFVFDYLDQCIYIVIFYDDNIDIYLEGRLVFTVTTTGLNASDVTLIDHTILGAQARITTGYITPKRLDRSASAGNVITAVDVTDDFLTLTNALTLDIILPATITTAGTVPVTSPPLRLTQVYFIRALTTTTVALYRTAQDAAADVNRYNITAAGTGTSTIVPQNTWALTNIVFRNVPVYDFGDASYDTITFTPNVTTGTGTLTASAAIFTAAHLGGLYFGAGGVGKITTVTSTTVVDITVLIDFSGTTAIQGLNSALTEPAWSATRGFPRVCSSYQTRSAFANTELLPNGVWLSGVEDYENFDESSTNDGEAIGWYPSSDIGNYIRYLTPYRSLIVHTDTGVQSTPVQSDVAITPTNFSLTRQDDTPTANIQPVTIDNQVFVVAGKDVNSLLWEFGQFAYTSSLISASSEHLITDPYSMCAFRDQLENGGRYVFITNEDTGRLAMYQTLISEEVGGWTWAISEQNYGNAYFRYALSSAQGRCWFIMERELASPQTGIAISGFDADAKSLTATASAFSTTRATAILFTTTGTLPATVPALAVETYYYAVGIDANDFLIYSSVALAEADITNGVTTNAFAVSSAGTSSTVIPYTLTTTLTLEELNNTVKTDSAIMAPVSAGVASGLAALNAQTVTIKANGVTYDANPVINGFVRCAELGVLDTTLTEVEVGLPIQYQLTPMPLSIPIGQGIETSNLAQPKHIRYVNAMFANSVGGKINNQNIALKTLLENPFAVPTGKTGIMQVSVMSGWNDFQNAPFTITQSEPYDFTLTGLFYVVEV